MTPSGAATLLEKTVPKPSSKALSVLRKWGPRAAVVSTVLAGAAALNYRRAKAAERDNPPAGSFITLDGVRLHYLERGDGPTIVLLHGNGTMIQDWIAAGIFDELAKTHRVVAFDRPGFGYSERPRTRIWTPASQASLLAAAMRELQMTSVTVVGHSFGTLVALALALEAPDLIRGLVLVGGYYFPSARADVILASPPAVPLLGDLLRYTVSPLLGAALTPAINDKLFDPAPVPAQWTEQFPMELTLRPSQIRAEAAEAAMMIPAASSLSDRYPDLQQPTTIVAGSGDRVVDIRAQSERLHAALPQSQFRAVEGAGHMVHHTAPEVVLRAIIDRAS